MTSMKKTKPKQSTLAFANTSKPSLVVPSRGNPLSKVVLLSSSSQIDFKGKQKAKEVNNGLLSTTKRPSTPPDASNYLLWAEKYAPRSREDLAVHKQKVEEVYQWLAEALGDVNGGRLMKYRRILALTGPSGVGKTATLRMLAQNLGANVIEWHNTLDDWKIGDREEYSEDRLSLSRKFEQFLARGNEYSALSLASTSVAPPVQSKRLLLIDDIPNIQSRVVRDALHSALETFVEIPGTSLCPLVIIISEVGLRAEANQLEGNDWRIRQQESVNFRTVFPLSLQASPLVANIAFNPIATTLLKRGLNTVLSAHYGTSGAPFAKEFIDHVVHHANGDIRSAITSLQFADRGNTRPASSSRKKGDKARREIATQKLIESISQREQSLQLFHLLGKLLYNKRLGDSEKEDAADPLPPVVNELPDHLAQHRREPSKVDLNTIYNDSPIDSSMLALYVHQNFTFFCEEVEESEALCEWLSISDYFLTNNGLHNNVLSEYAFYLTSCGALHSLPTPVPRRNQKLSGPEYFESSRRMKIAEGQVEMVGVWLARNANLWHYPSTVIATEFSSIIASGIEIGVAKPVHEAFSSFSEIVRSTPMVIAATAVDDQGVEEIMNVERLSTLGGNQFIEAPTPDGWLTDDGIEDW